MGKTPKKAAPEGDERNRYVRRLKTASTSSKHDDISANLTATRSIQPEYENTNRGKTTGTATNIQKTTSKSAATSKTFKSKLRSPVVKSLSLSRLPKSTNKPLSLDSKESSSRAGGLSSKVLKQKTLAMQPKSEESGAEVESVTRETAVREEYVIFETEIIKTRKGDAVDGEKKVEIIQLDTDAEEKAVGEIQEKAAAADPEVVGESQSKELKVQVMSDAIAQVSENDDSKEETEEHEAKLNLTIEDSPLKVNLKEELNGSEESGTIEEELQLVEETQKENGYIAEDRENQSEDLADTESCSVDVVESTTSDMSEASELAQIESEKTTGNELPVQMPMDDVSFVSFDASILLKDVQVRLNDCLKDNSQLFEVTNAERSMSEPACKDSSFGRTLRNISGRHSINRMRHVTVRSRLSPNSSLFVNMSSVSLPDEDARDHKILRHRTGLSSTLTCNGTPVDRKRKLEPEECSEAKKVKTDSESSLFSASIGILQGLRRPIQVSTPNVGAYKFNPEKLDISGIVTNEEKVVNQEESGAARKWCSIM